MRSILYSSQRRVALVDNRIVGVGDQISAGVWSRSSETRL
jgi:hypothetical protein